MKKKINEVEMNADEIQTFKDMLFNGEGKFKFKKVDGTIREARGTMCPDLLPPPPPKKEYDEQKLQNKKPPRKRPEGIICYYDLDSKGFRSFKTTNFEGFM